MGVEIEHLQHQKNSQLTTIHYLQLEINALNGKKIRLEKAKQEMTNQIHALQGNKQSFERINVVESEWKGETAKKFENTFHTNAMTQLKAYIQKIDLVLDEISEGITRISNQIENKNSSISQSKQKINHINSQILIAKR